MAGNQAKKGGMEIKLRRRACIQYIKENAYRLCEQTCPMVEKCRASGIGLLHLGKHDDHAEARASII